MERTELDSVSVDVAERLRAGSRDALAEAYERWAGLVHAIALRALGDHHDAEDVTQQVFVSAWRSRETIRVGPDALPGWLVGITRHRIADVRTQQARSLRNTAAIAATLPRHAAQPVEDDGLGEEDREDEAGDVTNGLFFAQRNRGRLLYVAASKDWYMYVAGYWTPQARHLAIERAKDAASALLVIAKAGLRDAAEAAEAAAALVQRAGTSAHTPHTHSTSGISREPGNSWSDGGAGGARTHDLTDYESVALTG